MFVGEATMWLGTGDWSLPLTAWLSVWRPAGTYWKWGSLSMYARDPARSSGLSQSSLLENAGNCGFAHRGCLSPAFSSRLSQSDPIFLGERERDIYDSMEWSWLQYSNSLKPQLRVGSSTTQHLSFFSGGQLSPINKDSQKALSKEAEEAEQGRPWGILTGPWVKSGNFIFEGFSFSGNSKFCGEWCILYKWIIHVMYVNRFWGYPPTSLAEVTNPRLSAVSEGSDAWSNSGIRRTFYEQLLCRLFLSLIWSFKPNWVLDKSYSTWPARTL